MTPKPLYPHRKQRLLDTDMTLCLAAFSVEVIKPSPLAGGDVTARRNVVCCFDKRTETDTAGSETAFKFRKVGKNWAALFAGSIPRAEELINLYSSRIPAKVVPESSLMEVLREPPRTFKRILVEEYVQTRLAMSYDEFIAKGSSSLPQSVFENISTDISRLQLGCQLILVPLHDQPSKHLYSVDLDGSVYPENNFVAIGTGASGATAWLHYRAQQRHTSVSDTVRHLIEAKKFCETAPGVGKRTHIILITNDRKVKSLAGPESERERKSNQIWAKYGPRNPKKTDLQINELLSGEYDRDKAAIG